MANQANTVSVLRNDGKGGFLAPIAFPTGRPADAFQPQSVDLADLDGDGLLDIAASGDDAGSVAVLLADGLNLADFGEAAVIPVGSPSGNAFRIGDFNNDDRPDLLVGSTTDNLVYLLPADPAAPTGFQSPPADFSVLVENTDGTFTRRMKDGTVFQFDTAGRMTAEIDSNDNTTRYFYDANGRLTKVIDPTNALDETLALCGTAGVTCYTYDGAGRLASVIDPTGRTTSMLVDGTGDLRTLTNADTSTRQFTYDANHRLISELSERGFPTAYDYGFAGQWTGTGFPDGSSVSAKIADEFGLADLGFGLGTFNNPDAYVRPEDRISTITDGRGFTTTVEVDEFGQPVRITDAVGRIKTFQRNADNLPFRVTVPTDGEVPAATATLSSDSLSTTSDGFTTAAAVTQDLITELEYDERGNVIVFREAVGTTLQRETRFQYEPAFNKVTKIIDPSNALADPACGTAGVTCFDYDTDGNLTTTVDGLGTLTTRQYALPGCAGMPTGITAAAGLPEQAVTQLFYDASTCNVTSIIDPELNEARLTLDAVGNTIAVIEDFGALEERRFDFTHDAFNRLESWTDDTGALNTLRYDDAGNMVEHIDPTDVTKTWAYDTLDRLLRLDHPTNGTILWTYDANGNVETITDALNETTRFEYDGFNRLSKIIDPLLQEQVFTYTQQDEIRTVQDARGNVTRFDFDILARLIRRANPLEETSTFSYDSRDNLIGAIDPKLQPFSAEYDALSHLTRSITPDDTLTFTHDALGNLRTAVDGDSSLAFAYDKINRRISQETAGGGIQPLVTLTAAIDAVGNLRELSDTAGGTTLFDYDPVGRLKQLTSPGNLNVSLGYDLAGRNEQIAFPNGTATSFGYNLDGLLTSVTHSQGASAIGSFGYTYDAARHVRAIAEPGKTRNFAYDQLQRLVSGGTSATPESYTYDAQGNRLTSHLSTAHLTDAANRLLADDHFCYAYDANGNLTTKAEKVAGVCTTVATTYSWDTQDQLVRIDFPDATFAAYRYDALGRRIEKDVNGTITRYVYDGWDIVQEYDGTGALIARYSHGDQIDQPLVMERGGQSYFYHTDHQGSVRKVTDASGTVVNSYDYDSYGRFESRIETVPNPFAFTGREYDPESGLYFYRFRYYDPETGRFLSEDPLGFRSGDFNIYRYTLNDPLNQLDPFGLAALSESATTAAQAGARQPQFLSIGRTLVCLVTIATTTVQAADQVLQGDFGGAAFTVASAGTCKKKLSVKKPPRKRGRGAKRRGGKRDKGRLGPMTKDQVAMKDLVEEATNQGGKPLPRADAETVLDWAQEYDYPGWRAGPGDLASPSNWKARPVPHIHMKGAGRNTHVPVAPGVRPRC